MQNRIVTEFYPAWPFIWVYGKINNYFLVKKDHENKVNAIEELNKIEGFDVHGIVFDSLKHGFKHSTSSIVVYKYRYSLRYEYLKIAGSLPVVYLVETDDGSFRGLFLPRDTGDYNKPFYDEYAKAFTIDRTNGLQFIEDERFQKHEICIDRSISEWFRNLETTPILRCEDFMCLYTNLKWSETQNSVRKQSQRVIVVAMHKKKEYVIPPVHETKMMKANYDLYINKIKEDFEIDPGIMIFDTNLPHFSKKFWFEENENFTFVVEHEHNSTTTLYVGFFEGRINSDKWQYQRYSAIGRTKMGGNDKYIRFCPNRLPDTKCFKFDTGNNRDHCQMVHFTKDFEQEMREYERLSDINEQAAERMLSRMKVVGFVIKFSCWDVHFSFNETESFCHIDDEYGPGCVSDDLTEGKRLLIFKETNVDQLRAKINKSLN